MKKTRLICSLVSIVLLTSCLLTGCGSSARYDSAMQESAMMDYAGFDGGFVTNKNMAMTMGSSSNSGGSYSDSVAMESAPAINQESFSSSTVTEAVPSTNKIIYRGSLRVQTSDIAKTEAIVTEKINEYGGYVSSYNKNDDSYINIVARIPSNNFGKMIDDEDIAKDNTVSKQMSAEDVTLQYSDTEARLESLRIQEERLLTYLQSAANVEEMMEIESTLQNVREEITTVTNRLKYLDNYISYSELEITLSARYIAPVDDASFLERIKFAFLESIENVKDFFENLVISLILGFPVLVFWALVIVIVVFAIKKAKKKRENKRKLKEKTENTEE